jgi:hypothetical protein
LNKKIKRTIAFSLFVVLSIYSAPVAAQEWRIQKERLFKELAEWDLEIDEPTREKFRIGWGKCYAIHKSMWIDGKYFKCLESILAIHASEVRGVDYLPIVLKQHQSALKMVLLYSEAIDAQNKEIEKSKKFSGYKPDYKYALKLVAEIEVLEGGIAAGMREDTKITRQRMEYFQSTFAKIRHMESEYFRKKLNDFEISQKIKKEFRLLRRERRRAEAEGRNYERSMKTIFGGLKMLSNEAGKNEQDSNTFIMNGKIITCQNLQNNVRSCNW